jgi:hypothetical protein
MARVTEQVIRGAGGWVRYARSDSAVLTYVRYDDVGGRLEPVEIYLERHDDGALTTDSLRQLPLGRISASVLSRPDLPPVARHATAPGPDLRRLARRFLSAIKPDPTPVKKPFKLPTDEPDPNLSAKLQIPQAGPRQPYPDEFFEQVAEIYQRLAPWVRSPASAIRDANNIENIATVHRWIKVARQRGLLASPNRGRA